MDNNNNIALAGGYRNGNRIKGRRTLSYTVIPTLLLFITFLPGCSPKITERIITITQTEVRDSLVWRDTTLYVPIPLESDQVIVQVGDTSRLSTSVAESVAFVGGDGFLHHTLENKRAPLEYQFKWPEHILTTTVTNTTETAHIITREVKVEKPLSWWQKARMRAFWWLLGCLILCFAWIFRKPLLKFKNLWLKL